MSCANYYLKIVIRQILREITLAKMAKKCCLINIQTSVRNKKMNSIYCE